MAKGYFVLIKSEAKQPFHFVLKAANHETIFTSENYASKDGALNGIDSVKKNATDTENYEVRTAKNGKPYFILKAKNHQIIGQSQFYASEQSCKNGIESVMNNAPDADVKDQTV
ncbi:YegP family protein [Sulfurovum sp. CS9]|uniref:YegP family protein n=1 Tax=Sulfurovum sp. CS9 TaxID=3391146 RepID=UPI0039EC3863